jgi:hypothetical protein
MLIATAIASNGSTGFHWSGSPAEAGHNTKISPTVGEYMLAVRIENN